MASSVVYVRMCPKSAKALRALRCVADFVAEKCADSWNPEEQKVLRAMQYVAKNMGLEQVKEQP